MLLLNKIIVLYCIMIFKIESAKNKFLSVTIWSNEKIPVAWTYPAREHYKKANFL